jgi:hypothetical protein
MNVKAHNSNPNKTYKKGINRFSDLTKEEFKNIYLTKKHSNENLPSIEFKYSALADSVDLRKTG